MAGNGKRRVAVLFGGRSTEHEISVITALQVMDAFDSTRYEVMPVYVAEDGEWYTGEALRGREFYIPDEAAKKSLTRVRLEANRGGELEEADPPSGWFGSKAPAKFPVDVYFPAFHGAYGEDGCVQGLLEWIGAPYAGSPPMACALGMNKHACKSYLRSFDIPVLPDVLLDRSGWNAEEAHVTAQRVLDQMDPPVMVKPCNLGSSIGASAAHDLEQLMVSLAGAFAFDRQVMAEPLLEDMYEVNISVLAGSPPRVSAHERPKRESELLTFEQKYLKGNKKIGLQSMGMASLDRDINPAGVPAEIVQQIRSYAIDAFQALGCGGLVRFDFMVDRAANAIYFNEVNPLPGSLSHYLWEKASPPLPFTELLTTLVEMALETEREKRRSRRQLERRIFKE